VWNPFSFRACSPDGGTPPIQGWGRKGLPTWTNNSEHRCPCSQLGARLKLRPRRRRCLLIVPIRCRFEADSSDIVRDVNDAAKIRYSRIVEALDLSPWCTDLAAEMLGHSAASSRRPGLELARVAVVARLSKEPTPCTLISTSDFRSETRLIALISAESPLSAEPAFGAIPGQKPAHLGERSSACRRPPAGGEGPVLSDVTGPSSEGGERREVFVDGWWRRKAASRGGPAEWPKVVCQPIVGRGWPAVDRPPVKRAEPPRRRTTAWRWVPGSHGWSASCLSPLSPYSRAHCLRRGRSRVRACHSRALDVPQAMSRVAPIS
jgi:hypothetical protein